MDQEHTEEESADREDGGTKAEDVTDAEHDGVESEQESGEEPSVEAVDESSEEDAPAPVPDGEKAEGGEPPPAKRPRWMMVGQLLLAPLLAAGAVGVHWWLNVPDEIVESSRDQGSKKKKKKKRARRQSNNRRGEKTRDQVRTIEQLDADWESFKDGSFEDEPIRKIWARRHQALINRAVVVARHQGFQGAPEQPRVVLVDTKCRTVRCRFTLRSPYRHELDVISESLSRLQSNDEDVWRSFEAIPVESSVEDEEDEPRIQFTVAFHTDETDTRGLAIPEDAAAEPEGAQPEAAAGTPEAPAEGAKPPTEPVPSAGQGASAP